MFHPPQSASRRREASGRQVKNSPLHLLLFAYINMEESGGAEYRRTRIDVMPHVAPHENAMAGSPALLRFSLHMPL